MADKKITDLTELTAAASDDYLEIVDTSANTSNKISRENLAGWHFLTTPLYSTAWDGDAFSTTSKTKIDLSEVFGVPAGVKAVLVLVNMRDSASTTTYSYMYLSPSDTANSGLIFSCDNGKNDGLVPASATVPCDANGDIYYQVAASGPGTMDVTIQIWGYWL